MWHPSHMQHESHHGRVSATVRIPFAETVDIMRVSSAGKEAQIGGRHAYSGSRQGRRRGGCRRAAPPQHRPAAASTPRAPPPSSPATGPCARQQRRPLQNPPRYTASQELTFPMACCLPAARDWGMQPGRQCHLSHGRRPSSTEGSGGIRESVGLERADTRGDGGTHPGREGGRMEGEGTGL